MSQIFRLAFCLALLLSAPMFAAVDDSIQVGAVEITKESACETKAASVALFAFGEPSMLSNTAVPQGKFFFCPEAFAAASWCSQCWTALRQCSGPDCYICTELCLARLGCWVP